MGSFVGHIDEAIFFLVLAFWWMFRMFPLYIKSRKISKRFKAQLSYSLTCRRSIPLEAILKFLFPFAGLIGEMCSGGLSLVDEDGRFRKLPQMQHMSIYTMFILHALLDLLTTFRLPIPPKLNYISAAISFFWYGTSFSYHAHMEGKMPLENTIHILPVSTMYFIAVIALLEMNFPYNFQLVLMRIIGLLVLGTWFTQAAFVMYLPHPWPGSELNPAWDQEDPHNTHAIIASYGFHIILAIVIITITYSSIHFFSHHFNSSQQFGLIQMTKGDYKDEDDDEDDDIGHEEKVLYSNKNQLIKKIMMSRRKDQSSMRNYDDEYDSAD